MAVLILSPFFFPEPISTGKYNTFLAQRLVARGQNVVTIASHPLYPKWRPEYSEAQLPSIRIERGGSWISYPRSGVLRRAVLEIWYAAFVFYKYLRIDPKPRHVVAVFPPNLFFVLLQPVLAGNTTTIGVVHDLQAVLATTSKSAVRRIVQKVVARLEKRSFAKCQRLVFLSHSMAEHAIRMYKLNRARCRVCYPFQTISFRGDIDSQLLAKVMPPNEIHVVYSGALGDKQCPEELFTFMARLARRHRVRCHIFSSGPHFEKLRGIYSNTGHPEVSLHDLVPEEELEELYLRSAIQLIPQARGTSDGSLPSKLPNLLTAGVPIFAICDSGSEIARILTESGGGVSAYSFDGEDTMARFDGLLKSIELESRRDRAVRLRAFVDSAFSIERVVDAILAEEVRGGET
jgi:colanic acid biosynthesis glycosyl transferase WcaI